jgi:LacI family transcriptional regulator
MTDEKKSANATILDVAKLAGVSKSTASKALNNQNYVSEETRVRVLDAARKLNFSPNQVAQSLKRKRTFTIGLITDDLEGLFTTSMLRGVEEAVSSNNFNVILCNSFGEAAHEKAHLELLLTRQIDGIILLSGYRVRERGAPALELENIPVVYLYQYTNMLAAPCVIPDDFGGATLGTRHLIQLGRKRIAFINGPTHYEATHQRLDGYRQALEAAGIQFDPSLVFTCRKWHQNYGYDAAHELMTGIEPPDALFCASDSLAIGALDALHELGYSIPQDVSVVGFDNRPHSAHQRPPLTSVALPFHEMGKFAGELLIESILNGAHNNTLYRVPCYLVQRQSCGGQISSEGDDRVRQ